jgi:hypothetical protein
MARLKTSQLMRAITRVIPVNLTINLFIIKKTGILSLFETEELYLLMLFSG